MWARLNGGGLAICKAVSAKAMLEATATWWVSCPD